MKKITDKLVAIILCFAVLLSTVIIGGVMTATMADDSATVTNLPDNAPKSEYLSKSYVFDFDEVWEYGDSKDYGVDKEGNVFYPLRSKNNGATAKQKNFVVDGKTVTTVELSTNSATQFIPTDENGQPFIIEPNTRYDIKITYYNMASNPHGQFWAGGGMLNANVAKVSSVHDKNFLIYEEQKRADNKPVDVLTTGWNPYYRSYGENWSDKHRYNPNPKFITVSKYFLTKDHAEQGGMFYNSTYEDASTPNDDSYGFGQYLGFYFSASNVSYDDGNGTTYSGNNVYYIDKIEIIEKSTRVLEVGESYTFNFNEGEVIDTTVNSTKLTDGDGNTFYPLHASSTTASSAKQENITVKLDDKGNTQTVGTLKFVNNGKTSYIPTDANGMPFVLEPNTKYKVDVVSYSQYVGSEGQFFTGGGAYEASVQKYSPLTSSYNSDSSWYYVNGTNNGSPSAGMYAAYPMFRTASFNYASAADRNMYSSSDPAKTGKLRYFEDFVMGRAGQYQSTSSYFLTSDYEETVNENGVGTNSFNTDLWRWYYYVKGGNKDLGITDPYSDLAKENGVVIENKNVGAYFCIYGEGSTVTAYYDDGSGNRVAMPTQYTTFYIDSITITKVSTTNTEEVTFDAQGGTFGDGEATLTTGQTVMGAPTVETPVNADTTVAFAGWSTHPNSDVISVITPEMIGKTLYAVWKPAVSNVTFNANGGTLANGSATKATTQFAGMKLTEQNPTRAGYIFMGWGTSANATTPVTLASANMAGTTLYALWKADPVTVTFNANGGKFTDGSTSKVISQVMDVAPSAEEPTRSIDKFIGWGTSADATTPVSTITKAMDGTTLYAIYKESHPANGVYDSWNRTVEFDQYIISGGVNTFIPTGPDYGENSGVPYFTIIDDPDQPGDKLLHFYNHSKASNWYANWCITPTYNGVSGTTEGREDYNVLPTDSTFKVTLRVHVKNVGTAATFAMYYGANNGRQSTSDQKNTAGYKDLINSITETDGFVTMETYFTTPKEYTVTEKGVANRLYMGFTEQQTNLEYDLDYIKIEKVTTVNLYAKVDGKTTLVDTIIGHPGTAMDLPEIYSVENYDFHYPQGSVTNKAYGNWFNDAECTEAAILKFGNFNYSIYCDNFSDLPSLSTENQDMFAGFDFYSQRTEGLKNATITSDTANSGKQSLKAEVSADKGAAFEIKNDFTFDFIEGKTYRVDFAYKASADANLKVGTANGLVANGVTALATTNLKATDNWSAASVVFTANNVKANDILAATISANADAVVYVDTIVVSSVTESVGVEAETTSAGEALRFMLTYYGSDERTVSMAGNSFTVTEHGVLVKAEEVETALDLANKNAAGIFHFAQTDMSKNWSVNPITGTTVYTAYLNGFDKTDDYKVSVRGYIKLSDGTVFYTDVVTASVTDIPAAADLIPENADLSNFYVYLPAGTSFPADKNYNVTTYNNVFTANNAVSNNVLTEDSYVLFSAKPDFAKINVPSESKYLVHAGAKEELYFALQSEVVSNEIDTVGGDAVNYIFITDIHYGSDLTSAQNVSLRNQTTLIAKMANENDNIDFVVVGGDTTTGMYGSKADAIKWTQAALDPLLECEKPVFILMGNHDDNSYHIAAGNKVLFANRVISDLDWQNYIIDRYTNKGNIQVVQDDPTKRANSKYYYYDLEGKKTRVIALDALDYEAKYDENGYVLEDLNGDGLYDGMPIRDANGTSDTARYHNGYTYWGYSADQIRWLAEDALGDLPEDYDVIFVSHMGIDKNTNAYGTKIWFCEELRQVIKNFNAGGSYSANLTDIWGNAVNVSADFSSKDGKIVAYQFGHMHMELTHYDADVDLWQFSTGTASVANAGSQLYENIQTGNANNKSLPWRVYTRKLGTPSEACFNAMSVTSERIYRYTVGPGINEKVVYTK